MRTFVPGDVEGFAALHGGPGICRDDDHAAGGECAFADGIDRENILYAGDGFGFGGVELRGLAAEDGAAGDYGVDEAGWARVDAEFRGAAGFGASFEASAVVADDGEVAANFSAEPF